MSWIITGTEKNKGLLDEFSGAAAAYSLRDLSVRRNAPVVRVRRSSDNTEQDFTAAQITDGTLTAFCGAGDGFVCTWYDQSGNSRHAANITAAQQPKIVSSGALIAGGVSFDGSNDRLFLPQPFSGLTGRSLFCVVDAVSTGVNQSIFALAQTLSVANGSLWSFSAETAVRLVGAVEWTSTPMTAPSLGSIHLPNNSTISNHTFYRNGSLIAPVSISSGSNSVNTIVVTNSIIGCAHNEAVGNFYNGTIAELIVYASDRSANRAGIEANINAHYGIF